MRGQKFAVTGLAALMAFALACSGDPATSTNPSSAIPGGTAAGVDGETLKVGAPTLISPLNDAQPPLLTLTATAAPQRFVSPGVLQYNFQIINSANVVVANDIANGPVHNPTAVLDFGKRYTWKVRGTLNGAFGPFSATGSFLAPAGGYNIAGELYDPLLSGKSVGTIHGDHSFVPGVGLKLESNGSYVDYPLPATIEGGEISAVVTNICSCSGQPGIKTRIFSMSQGYDNMTDNDRRFTAEKRSGSDKGVVAWRFITRQDQIDTEGSERVFVSFDPTHTYLWRAAWGNNDFLLTIDDLTTGGRVYSFGKSYDGVYNPTPHVAFLGAPDSTSGRDSQTVANMIVRHFWVSTRGRPTGISQ